MLNVEKYKDEILKICNLDGRIALTDNGVHMCGSVRCKNCKFHGERNCIARTLEWLLAEYKEPIKLTRFEYEILKHCQPKWKWLARDKDGRLLTFDKKPYRWSSPSQGWGFKGDLVSVSYFLGKDIFQFVKWDDEEPWNIKEILEHCEVIDDD